MLHTSRVIGVDMTPEMIDKSRNNKAEGDYENVGFTDIRIRSKDESREFIKEWAPGRSVEDCIVSATIEAVKP